jgi:hypothetical protein
MILADVMDEVARVMEQITGLRVQAYPPASVSAPAGYVSYPQTIDFDETYGRGEDQFTDLPIVLIVGKATDRSARDTVSGWSAGDGPNSIKALAEAHSWATCDDLTIEECEFDFVKLAGVDYLAALFKATVVGPGKED